MGSLSRPHYDALQVEFHSQIVMARLTIIAISAAARIPRDNNVTYIKAYQQVNRTVPGQVLEVRVCVAGASKSTSIRDRPGKQTSHLESIEVRVRITWSSYELPSSVIVCNSIALAARRLVGSPFVPSSWCTSLIQRSTDCQNERCHNAAICLSTVRSMSCVV